MRWRRRPIRCLVAKRLRGGLGPDCPNSLPKRSPNSKPNGAFTAPRLSVARCAICSLMPVLRRHTPRRGHLFVVVLSQRMPGGLLPSDDERNARERACIAGSVLEARQERPSSFAQWWMDHWHDLAAGSCRRTSEENRTLPAGLRARRSPLRLGVSSLAIYTQYPIEAGCEPQPRSPILID